MHDIDYYNSFHFQPLQSGPGSRYITSRHNISSQTADKLWTIYPVRRWTSLHHTYQATGQSTLAQYIIHSSTKDQHRWMDITCIPITVTIPSLDAWWISWWNERYKWSVSHDAVLRWFESRWYILKKKKRFAMNESFFSRPSRCRWSEFIKFYTRVHSSSNIIIKLI